MQRVTRCAVVASLALVGLTVIPAVVPSAVAAGTDGKVTVRVVQEVNANGLVDSTTLEPPLVGVKVAFTDGSGATEMVNTDANGLAVLDPATSTLVGGKYRVDVANPKPGTYEPGFVANGQSVAAAAITPADLQTPANAKLSSSTEFVDVSDAQDAYVNTSFWYPPYYCQDNAAVCGANQPWNAIDPGAQSAPTEQTLFSVPYKFTQGVSKLAENQDTGTVFGIAYDRTHERIFSAAYAKRGGPYGAGGPGGIYVTDLTSGVGKGAADYPLQGTTSLWKTVANAGTDNHAMATDDDLGFMPHVGKESLGDIDITDDGHYLYGVNEFDKTVFVYDLHDDSYLGSYAIPNPCANPADWRPMGTGSGISGNLVGGVCTGQVAGDMSELSAHVYTFEPATGAFGDQVLSQSLTYDRGFTIRPVLCDGTLDGQGRWFAWIDTNPWGPNEQQQHGCDGPAGGVGHDGTTAGDYWVAYPQPMMSDIVEETNGDIVMSFRDRTADQGGSGALMETVTGAQFYNVWGPASGGDLVRGCNLTDGMFVLDPNYDPSQTLAPGSVCTNNNGLGAGNGGEGTDFREYYIGDWRVNGSHTETFFGGMALSRVEPNIDISGMDPTDAIMTQGVSAVNRDGNRQSGAPGAIADQPSDRFGKGAGLADLEVLCDQAPLQIGNRIWADADGNGIQDAGEPGLAGVTVNLYDADGGLVGTTTTSANGNYNFDDSNVPDGLQQNTAYVVKLDESTDYASGGPLAGRTPTVANAGSDDGHDSDGVVPSGGTYPQISLTTAGAGQDNHSYDFGFTPPVSIGDYLWIDANGNGVQDEGEAPVANATVTLLDAEGDVVATTTTDANGYYAFADLSPSTDYTVQFPTAVTVDGIKYSLTKPSQGADTAKDSNPNPSTGKAAVTTPASGSNLTAPGQADNPTIDAGYAPPVSIGDYLWLDVNGNGVQEDGEAPVANATVTLLDAEGDVVATTTTDANGYYAFADLAPNTQYTVQFPTTVTVAEIDYVLTRPSLGGDTATDSNPNPSTGKAAVTTPASGSNLTAPGQTDDPTIDAGYVPKPVSIGDYLWIDGNGNGVQDAGESPVPGATVTLLDADGDVVASTTTDADGYYAFTGLAPNRDYTVQFPTVVTVDGINYGLTAPSLGGDTAKDSNPDQATGKAAVTTPTSGSNLGTPGLADNPTIDAGYVPMPVSIGDYLWLDSNGNGVQDAGEAPVAGATVTLLDAEGGVVATTTTDADGYYAFADLSPDTDYTVQFPTTVSVDGIDYALTAPSLGGDTAKDSNPDQATGKAPVTTPKSGSNLTAPGKADDPTIDAGYRPKPVSIGDYLWLDTNGNGIQDAGEKPVPNATVTLLDAHGNVAAATTTDKNGYYAFTGLAPNTDYVVQFPKTVTVGGAKYALTQPGLGGDTAKDSNPNPSTGQAPVTTPKSGTNLGTPGQADNPTIDAGYVPLVSVGSYLWLDTDGNGVQDAGEKPVPNATVTLLDADGTVVATTKTDKDGHYTFTDLLPNTKYLVQFPKTVTVDGITYPLTKPSQGNDRATDSDPNQQTGLAAILTPGFGSNSAVAGQQDIPNIDAGYTPPPAAPLATTGVDAAGILRAALLLFLAGGIFLLTGRRKQATR